MNIAFHPGVRVTCDAVVADADSDWILGPAFVSVVARMIRVIKATHAHVTTYAFTPRESE